MNLLPLKQKKEIKMMLAHQNVFFIGFILIILTLILIVFLGSFLIFLNIKYYQIEKQIIEEQSKIIQTETVKSMEKNVKELNAELKDLKEAENKKSHIYEILADVNEKFFKNVQLYSLSLDEEEKTISVSGYAALREDLLGIKKAIEEDKDYNNLDFPIANLTNPINIRFNFSFGY